MELGSIVLGVIAGLIAGAALGYTLYRYRHQQQGLHARAEAERLLDEAQTKAKELELKGHDEAIRVRDEAEKEAARRRTDLQREEERLARKREQLDDKLEKTEQRERRLSQRQGQLDKQASDLAKLEQQRTTEMARIAQMTVEEAKRHLSQGQFPAGSMGPKILAAVQFVEATGAEALITAPEQIQRALAGTTGTRITGGAREGVEEGQA